MPIPTIAAYSIAALVAAHTAFRDLIDGNEGAGLIQIRDAADVLLAEIPLTLPCGTVNAATGRLTLTASEAGWSDNAGGPAAYAEVCDGAGLVHLAMPVQAGATAVSGRLVLNTLTLTVGGAVQLGSATVG